MSWRDKVQAMRDGVNSQKCLTPSLPKPPKPPKPSFVSFGTSPPTPFYKKTGFADHEAASNDPASFESDRTENPAESGIAVQPPAPALDLDRWCWPHSEAMTGREIDAFAGRSALFNRRGMPSVNAEGLAYKLLNRDREADDRRLCLECSNLSRAGGWRCSQWQRAGLGATGVPADLVLLLQRCDGFGDAR